jgi:hypothetical protein
MLFRIPRRAWKSQARRHSSSVIAGTLKALDMHKHLLSFRSFQAYSMILASATCL